MASRPALFNYSKIAAFLSLGKPADAAALSGFLAMVAASYPESLAYRISKGEITLKFGMHGIEKGKYTNWSPLSPHQF